MKKKVIDENTFGVPGYLIALSLPDFLCTSVFIPFLLPYIYTALFPLSLLVICCLGPLDSFWYFILKILYTCREKKIKENPERKTTRKSRLLVHTVLVVFSPI